MANECWSCAASWRRIVVCAAAAFLLPFACVTVGAQPSPGSAGEGGRVGGVFRIGCFKGDAETLLGSRVFDSLRAALLSNGAVREAMMDEDLVDLALIPAASHENLVQRMDVREFDMVFCSAKDFVSQSGDYEPVFQLRRPHDRVDSRGGPGFHYGVLFVNNRSAMFDGDITPQRLEAFFRGAGQIAVGPSAAAYDYPLLKMAAYTSNTLPRRIMICESSEEVVKTVVNGIAELGACDAGVIEKVMRDNGLEEHAGRITRVILETDLIPTDPVALREKWMPSRSSFGRVLCDALRQYFSRPDLPRLEISARERYKDLGANMLLVRRLRPQ